MKLTASTGKNLAPIAGRYFPLPMDSLALAQIALALSMELGFEVPVRLLFDATSPEGLAEALTQHAALSPPLPGRLRSLPESRRRQRRRLSFSQERMCFMRAMSGASTAYHVTVALRLHGNLDQTALAEAVAQLPALFPLLRTRYVPTSAGAEPVVEATRPLKMDVHGSEEIADWVVRVCSTEFDLEGGNTSRAALLTVTPLDHVLLLVIDHSVVDLHSVEMLLQALADTYAHLCGSRPSGAVPPRESYNRYAEWHRRWFREYSFVESKEYWLKRLHLAERVSLEPDFPPRASASFHGRRFRLQLPEECWQSLEQLAKSGQSTLPMLLYCILALAVANRTGSRDLVIGMPFACRHHEGASGCFGPLINTLALRIEIDYALSFRQLLLRARKEFLDAFENQDMPFDVLVDQLRLPRLPGLSPLFGIMLNVLNTQPARMNMPGLLVERMEVDRGGAQFDLTLTVDRIHTGAIWFEYATDLYRPETIAKFAELFDCIVREVLGDADRLLIDLPHRVPRDAAAIASWRSGPTVTGEACDTFRQFCLAADRLPNKLAIVSGQTTLSYSEALARVRRLSAELRRVVATTNHRVGVLLERSADLPVVLLAALHSGIAFVPLDPAFPDERLAHMAKDSGLTLFIVDNAEYAREPWMPENAVTLSLDRVFGGTLNADSDPSIDPHRPAYLLYTSGSTGVPKGVLVSADALSCFLAAMAGVPGISEDDRLLAVTTLNFDISLLELLLPLTTGATVVVASRAEARDPQRLAELLTRHSISMLQGTPSMWWQLIETRWKGRRGLRALVGGETLSKDLASQLLPRVDALWNLYGPTETTIWSTCARISEPGHIVVGRPIAGTTIEIIDALNRPCGIETTGEIVIGGRGLAIGYLNLPEQTQSRFPSLPGVNGGSRVYRTGDLGRWDADGQLRILGRVDRQIKLRGHRIELQEVEAAAQTVPGVARAVAAVQHRSASDSRLSLFYTCTAEGDPGEAAVKAKLRSLLPDYMLPQFIRTTDAIPLLPNGKTDLNALLNLPEDDVGRTPGRPPESRNEQVMAAIWRELLDLPEVDCDQDFFSLGGHSLLAMRLVSRVRDEMQRRCTLAQLFANPTISTLCLEIERSPVVNSESLVPLQVEGRGTPLYCICGIQLYRRLVHELDLDAPVHAVYLPTGNLGIVELAGRYVDAIRSVQPHGPYQLLGFSLGGVLAYEMAQQLTSMGEIVEQLVILDSDVPGQSRRHRFASWLRRLGRKAAEPQYLLLMRKYEALPYTGEALYVKALQGDHFSPGFEWTDLVPALRTVEIDCAHLDLLAAPYVCELAAKIIPLLQPDLGAKSAGHDQVRQ